jgi:hypothetical protein
METIRTKEAAESLLRELPSVLGAHVREDIYGHPREVHLLVAPGPNVRHLARDIRDLLEERLRVPVDQRIISIAQLERPLDEAPVDEAVVIPTQAEEHPSETGSEPRMLFGGLETSIRDARVYVRVHLSWRGEEYSGEAAELDAGNGRVRAAASAALRAATAAATGPRSGVRPDPLRLELEFAAVVKALDRDYVLVSAFGASPLFGRRPLSLVGAQPLEGDEATAAALAALKAVNRVMGLRLRAQAS